MPKRFRQATAKHHTKRVIVRNMHDHIQGPTVRTIEPEALPAGCCHLVSRDKNSQPYPCTKELRFVELRIENRFVPSERAMSPVVKMLGWCNTHKPKRIVEGSLVELPYDIVRKVNGAGKTKAKIARMAKALYVDVASPGSGRIHVTERAGFKTVRPDANWAVDITVLCGKNLREAVVVTETDRRTEDGWLDCVGCAGAKEVVRDADEV